MSYPLAHRIKLPFMYVDAAHTDIRVRFRKVRNQQQKAKDEQPKVLPLREVARGSR